jgi:hypothetical protein
MFAPQRLQGPAPGSTKDARAPRPEHQGRLPNLWTGWPPSTCRRRLPSSVLHRARSVPTATLLLGAGTLSSGAGALQVTRARPLMTAAWAFWSCGPTVASACLLELAWRIVKPASQLRKKPTRTCLPFCADVGPAVFGPSLRHTILLGSARLLTTANFAIDFSDMKS